MQTKETTMTYEETHKIVNAISALETWSRALERQNNKEGEYNYEEVKRIEKWQTEARQEIFDLLNK
tara:strand:+ start:56 stop:253 length:198 start_codon:yes stop_codon:yes gene_type:complete